MKPRTRAKKIALVMAGVAFTAAILTLGLTIWSIAVLGTAHIATPSLVATTIFFFSCSAVLYGMSLMPRQLPPGEGEP